MMDEKQQQIHCLVDSCHYWNKGNNCQANKIMVTSSSFGASQPDEVDATRAESMSATPVEHCMDTCCKTFVTKEGKTKVDGIRKMT